MPKYIQSKQDLKRFLEKETSFYRNKWQKFLPINIGEGQILLKHICLLRKTEYYLNSGKKIRYILSRVRLIRLQNKFSLHIPLNVFDIGLHIMHLGPILVNHKAVVGKNCAIHINSGIVSGGIEGEPVLGDDIVIGIGSYILGNVYLADGIAVGANSTVIRSFEEQNIAIAGSPARKISNNGRFSWNKKKKCGGDNNAIKES